MGTVSAYAAKQNKGSHVVVFDMDGNAAVSYISFDALIRDIWKSLGNIPLTVDDKQTVNWFIFPKGTEKELSGTGLTNIIPAEL